MAKPRHQMCCVSGTVGVSPCGDHAPSQGYEWPLSETSLTNRPCTSQAYPRIKLLYLISGFPCGKSSKVHRFLVINFDVSSHEMQNSKFLEASH
uniref:Uncharacterized protein n=1 Tax=Myripristis murdjan TaxID=586833 RepID=A0A667X080_9TELE